MIYERQEGVPCFACTEYREKTKDYVVLIPIINEGERIYKARSLDKIIALLQLFNKTFGVFVGTGDAVRVQGV